MTRGVALQVACPYCKAEVGKQCRSKRSLRANSHNERYKLGRIIKQVRDGFMSIRLASIELDLTVDDVSEIAFGEVVL